MGKYHNKKTEVNGIVFDSKAEAERYKFLLSLENVGAIRNLKMQVPFILQPSFKCKGKNVQSIRYIADFVYDAPDVAGNLIKVVEDVKGFKTKEYEMKAKMFAFQYGFFITEVNQ